MTTTQNTINYRATGKLVHSTFLCELEGKRIFQIIVDRGDGAEFVTSQYREGDYSWMSGRYHSGEDGFRDACQDYHNAIDQFRDNRAEKNYFPN